MEVVGIDVPVMDFLIHTDKFPEPDNYGRLEEFSWQGGGKVSTALVTLGRLGIETGIINVIGGDSFGRFCREDFKRHLVDTSRLIEDIDGTACFCVCVSDNETKGRRIIGRGPTGRKLEVADLDKNYITSAKVLHLTNMLSPSCQAAVWAREKGMKVVIDADSYSIETINNIRLIDVFIASEFFYKAMFQDNNYEINCRTIIKMGPEVVIFTLGENGCVGMDKSGFFTLPAFKVKVMDTTGAGDVYHGAFIYGLLKGWDTKETARFASAVSAIKCTRIGGRAGIPDVATVERYMKEGTIDYTEIDKRVNFYRNSPFNVKSD